MERPGAIFWVARRPWAATVGLLRDWDGRDAVPFVRVGAGPARPAPPPPLGTSGAPSAPQPRHGDSSVPRPLLPSRCGCTLLAPRPGTSWRVPAAWVLGFIHEWLTSPGISSVVGRWVPPSVAGGRHGAGTGGRWTAGLRPLRVAAAEDGVRG